jgi:Tol biopolymer transport system component
MSKLILVPVLAGAILVAALAGAARSAHATFPGANGRVAFTDFTYGGTDNVFTMTPDGLDVRQLTFLTSDQGGDGEAAWSPDGSTLVFTEHSADYSTFRLWLMNADGSNKHLLLTEDPAYSDFQGNWSPDGSRVIFRRCNFAKEECSIYTVKTNGRGLTQITQPQKNAKGNNYDVKPEFSPDGKTISFSSFNRGGVQNGIYLMGAHGTNIHLITPTALEAVDADWAPNGSKIAFWTHCCNPEEEAIETVNPDGSGLQQLTFPGAEHDIRPSYSPQGDQIAFGRFSADFSTATIMTIPSGGGTPTPIHSGADPSWGPA